VLQEKKVKIAKWQASSFCKKLAKKSFCLRLPAELQGGGSE
jgi:hypothetical protein